MKYSHLLQKPHSKSSKTIGGFIQKYCCEGHFDTVQIGMAYVTVSGIRKVLEILNEETIAKSQWLIGLDDYLSQPGAIELCQNLKKSEVLVASFAKDFLRFHSKILYLTSKENKSQALMMIGSANLTKHGLTQNAESVVFLHADNVADREELDTLWLKLWILGRKLEEGELADYEKKYKRHKSIHNKERKEGKRKDKKEKTRKKKPTLILDDDEAEIDPSLANTCWIEVGRNTAMGRELEFKAEQGLFFGLNPGGGPPKFLTFLLSDGTKAKLRMKYQENHMWRLQMNNEVPEVAIGLRPVVSGGKLGRSPYVAVFKRNPEKNLYKLLFVKDSSEAYKNIKRTSRKKGTLGATSTRAYGWY